MIGYVVINLERGDKKPFCGLKPQPENALEEVA